MSCVIKSIKKSSARPRRPRVLIAKIGLDGHDRGVKIVAKALRDAGVEVIYLGLHNTPAEIVRSAVQEDVEAVGLSILSAAHTTLFKEVARLLKKEKATDIALFGGGIIPDEDRPALKRLGVREVFTPGAPMEAIVTFVRTELKPRSTCNSAEMKRLCRGITQGDVRAAGRLITAVERGDPSALPALKALSARNGRAHVIGITGPVGCGKSSLIAGLTACYRKKKQRVGVLAVDPTSPISGGAILGDRIRMRDQWNDPGVFIRSLASRGAPGGLPVRMLEGATEVLGALGMDVVFIETIGVGQDEVGVAKLAHTTAVVLQPALGDEVQLLKAGWTEIGDLYLINKSDLPGAGEMAVQLAGLVSPPVLTVSAMGSKGLEEVMKKIEAIRGALPIPRGIRRRS